MTQKSYLWDGVVTGDAVLAPYTKTAFNKFSHLKIISGRSEGYVIPGYLDDLKVEYAGNYLNSVNVRAGAALINNYVYVLDAALTVPFELPTVGYRRGDALVIRLDMDAGSPNFQTARLAVVKGTEQLVNTRLTLPVLTQDSSTWEVALALVYLENPATYNYILDGNIFDMRRFAITDKSVQLYNGKYNLVKNSEYKAFLTGTDYPEFWWSGGFTFLSRTTTIPPTSLRISGGTLAQYMPVRSGCRTFTVKGKLYSAGAAGDQSIVQLWGFRKDGSITKKHIRRMITAYFNDPTAVYYTLGALYEFQETITFDEDDIDYLELSIVDSGGTTYLGQCIVVPGYHPGPFRNFHEIIPFRAAQTDTAWDGDAKSTGTTVIDLTASFGGAILDGTKAIILRLRARDSGSAAGTPALYVQGYAAPFNTIYGQLELGGVTNDIWRELQVTMPIHQNKFYAAGSTPQFRIGVTATGAATLDAVVEIVGIIT